MHDVFAFVVDDLPCIIVSRRVAFGYVRVPGGSQLKDPSLMSSGPPLYASRGPLHASTAGNLECTLAALGVGDGDELSVVDNNLATPIVVVIRFE
jgi:hypothetical protein